MTESRKALIKLTLLTTALILANVLTPHLGEYISHEEMSFIVLTIVPLGGAVYAISNRKKINVFVKNWPSSLLYTAVVLYGCKILAEKAINAQTGIEVENIRYASTIGGFIYSVPFSLILIGLFMYLRMLFGSKPVKTNPDDVEHFPWLKIFFVGSILGLGVLTLEPADSVIPYTVIADTSKVTTCGPVEKDVVYVRKNSEMCKRIHVNPFEGIYESTDVPSKSG
ncbi:Transmembrane protein [Pseudomonas sp. IT-P2]|uniref:hypothetical protein n=1 Tax=Pseudomonas sp. IT-P2 TaxID=3026456 RepID=UPI0039E053EA